MAVRRRAAHSDARSTDGAFGIVERFSLRCAYVAPDRLEAPALTASLTSLDGTVALRLSMHVSAITTFWSGIRQLMPAGRRLSRAGTAKARKKVVVHGDGDLYRWGAVPRNL